MINAGEILEEENLKRKDKSESHREVLDTKNSSRNSVKICEPDKFDSPYRPVADCCEYGDERLVVINCGCFLNKFGSIGF